MRGKSFYGEGVSIGCSVIENIGCFGAEVERLDKKVEPRARKVECFSGKVESFIQKVELVASICRDLIGSRTLV